MSVCLDLQVSFGGQSLLVETLRVFDRFDLIDDDDDGSDASGGGGGHVTSLFLTFSTSVKTPKAPMAMATLQGLSVEYALYRNVVIIKKNFIIIYITSLN